MEQIRRDNDARLERFRRLRKALYERELEIVYRGIENIEELERIEDEERIARGSSEVPLDPVIALEQFSSETPVDQQDSLLSFIPPIAISEEAPRSQAVGFLLIPTYFLSLGILSI